MSSVRKRPIATRLSSSTSCPALGILQRSVGAIRDLALRLPDALEPSPPQPARVTAHDGRVWLDSLGEPAVSYVKIFTETK